MEAALAIEVPAAEVRDRLVSFVEEVVCVGCRCGGSGRTRFCMCVGWSSRVAGRVCSRRCFGSRRRLPATSRCSSFWPTRPGSRSCWSAPVRSGWRRRIGVVAWIVDDTGIVKDGDAFAGGEAAVLGHAGQDRQLPDHASACTRSASGGRCRWAGRCICPRSGATTCRAGARRRSPTQVVFKTKSQLAGDLCEQAAGWELPTAPILADCAYGDDAGFRGRLAQLELEYVVAVRAETSVYGPETSFAVPERNGVVGRPRTVARPDRRARVGACARRAAACGARGGRCPAGQPRRAKT